MYMLDTNICIYILKEHPLKVKHKFVEVENICISSVTYGELCFGIENGAADMQKERWNQLDLFTQCLEIESWDDSAARCYGSIRSLLKKQGNLIGNNDLLIAAHASSRQAVLVTNNMKEFERVPNLLLENWS